MIRRCPDCLGTGGWVERCPTCHGDGSVQDAARKKDAIARALATETFVVRALARDD